MTRNDLTIVLLSLSILLASCKRDTVTNVPSYGALEINQPNSPTLSDAADILEECLVSNSKGCTADNIPSYNLWWPEQLGKIDSDDFFSSTDQNSLLFTEYNNGTARLVGTTKMGSCVVKVEIWYNDRINTEKWLKNTSRSFHPLCEAINTAAKTNTFYTIDPSKSSITTLDGECGFRGLESFGIVEKNTNSSPSHYGSKLERTIDANADLDKEFISNFWLTNTTTDELLWPVRIRFGMDCANMGNNGCNTIYSYQDGTDVCTPDSSTSNQPNFTLGPINEGDYSFNLYTKNVNCDLQSPKPVGTVAISYEKGQVIVTYNIDKEYELMEAHTYAGKTILPLNDKGSTILLPDQYTISKGLHGDIYLITHAVICPKRTNQPHTL